MKVDNSLSVTPLGLCSRRQAKQTMRYVGTLFRHFRCKGLQLILTHDPYRGVRRRNSAVATHVTAPLGLEFGPKRLAYFATHVAAPLGLGLHLLQHLSIMEAWRTIQRQTAATREHPFPPYPKAISIRRQAKLTMSVCRNAVPALPMQRRPDLHGQSSTFINFINPHQPFTRNAYLGSAESEIRRA